MTYTVILHPFHGGKIVYKGKSLAQAVKIARQYDCGKHGCKAGPIVTNSNGETYHYWQAAAPFCLANEPFWV